MKIDPDHQDIYIEKNFFSQDIPVEARASVINSLFFNFQDNWKVSFWLMLALSTGIASLGLSQNSSATIIGAMIVAPLGQPIIAFGGAVALGWRKESFRMIGIILIGTISVIVVSFLFGLILKNVTPNQQVLLRTSPDLRDLGIAIFAGAAGAYGYYRREYSTVLAGVAIAVALIPPLCTCGLMLEQKRYILATGGALLFFTNLIGIAFSAILVFFLLGMKHQHNRKWFFIGSATIIAIGLAILVPLFLNYNRFAESAQFETTTYEKSAKILSNATGSPIIKSITIEGSACRIKIQPYPEKDDELKRLTSEIEKATGLQVILQSTTNSYEK